MSGFVHGRLASPQDTNETERSGGLQGITKNKTGRKRRFLVLRVLRSQHTTSRKEGILLGRDQGETGPGQDEYSRLANTKHILFTRPIKPQPGSQSRGTAGFKAP